MQSDLKIALRRSSLGSSRRLKTILRSFRRQRWNLRRGARLEIERPYKCRCSNVAKTTLYRFGNDVPAHSSPKSRINVVRATYILQNVLYILQNVYHWTVDVRDWSRSLLCIRLWKSLTALPVIVCAYYKYTLTTHRHVARATYIHSHVMCTRTSSRTQRVRVWAHECTWRSTFVTAIRCRVDCSLVVLLVTSY